ncbi:MAG: ATP-dependent DNA helicase [Hahellaceae bacterium]|nr:ATP-dependent DNA helicase [Hahellaceae bacterium]MCP5209858.1 ATP-dependent DNA helicase [Hahellaceae bacterium]
MSHQIPAEAHRIYEVGVKTLVDFACRQGDLVLAFAQSPTAEEGQRVHKKLQAARKLEAGVEVEVSLSVVIDLQVNAEAAALKISGRADVVHVNADNPLVEEIKSTYVAPELIPEGTKALHWSQAKIYAYALAVQHGWSQVQVRLLYFDLTSAKEIPLQQCFSVAHLHEFTHKAANLYLQWIVMVEATREKSRYFARQVAFPYPAFRAGQHAFAKSVYCAIRDKQNLIAQAPTGVGKTMSTLFPAIKAFGEQQVDKIVYLTAKQTGRAIAFDALEKLSKGESVLATLELRAKAKACVCQNGSVCLEDGQICPQTEGFFDRLPAAREALLNLRDINSEQIATVAAAHHLCAFELALQMLPWVDVVICDYNYVYDPLVRLSFFEETTDRIAVLVDEAHNLVERGRSMYSAQLLLGDAQRQQRLLGKSPLVKPVRSLVQAIKKTLASISPEQAHDHQNSPIQEQCPGALQRACERLLEALRIQQAAADPVPGFMHEWLKEVYRYIAIERLFNDNHRCLLHTTDARSSGIELFCIDPSNWLLDINKKHVSTIAFSATLSPADYFQGLIGLPENTPQLTLPSPFPQENLRLLIADSIDTRWHYRDRAVTAISDLIYTTIEQRAGKYMAFFSSYQFLRQVQQHFEQRYPDVGIMSQQADLSEADRELFLQQFDSREDITLAFVIIGGIFAEGIDYIGDRLIGAIIIGPGLPQPGLHTRLIQQKFATGVTPKRGFDYAFRYPALIRVLQSAGRVIRGEKDRGIIVLTDRRFATPDYLALYPPHWQPWIVSDTSQLVNNLRGFWDKVE